MSYSVDRFNDWINQLNEAFQKDLYELNEQDQVEEEYLSSEVGVTSEFQAEKVKKGEIINLIQNSLIAPAPLVRKFRSQTSNSLASTSSFEKTENQFKAERIQLSKLPKLSSLRVKLYDFYTSIQINNSDLDDSQRPTSQTFLDRLELYFLYQIFIGCKVLTTQKLIDNVVPLKDNLEKYKSYKKYGLVGELWYGLDLLPYHTYAGLRSLVLNPNYSFDTLINYDRSKLKVLSQSAAISPLKTLVVNPYKELRKEMGCKIGALQDYNKLVYGALGLISREDDSSLFLNVAQTTDINNLKKDLTKKIFNLTAVLNLMITQSKLPDSLEEAIETTSKVEQEVNSDTLYVQLSEVLDRLERFHGVVPQLTKELGPPGAFSQLLLPTLASYFTIQNISSLVWNHRYELLDYCMDIKEVAIAFFKDWIIAPLASIIDTIRHQNSELAITSKGTLQSDLQSLERMVANFASHHNNTTPLDIESVTEQVRHGDMTVILKAYESCIQNPIKNLLFGELIQTMLIQVQKTKVDVGLALNGLDQLLRSNELTFSLMAVIPPIVLTYYSAKWVRQWYKTRQGRSINQMKSQFRASTNHLFRILNHNLVKSQVSNSEINYNLNFVYVNHGTMLSEIQYLRYLSQNLAPILGSQDQLDLIEDLKELQSTSLNLTQKLNLTQHLYVAYPKLFSN